MTTDASAADTGFLTIDQAVARMDAAGQPEKDEQEAVEAVPANETEAGPKAEDASEPETATDGDDAEKAEEGDKPELPAIEPPRFWDAAAKSRFGELPRDLQELVLAKEVEHDKATSASLQKSAEARKAAEAEASRISQLTGTLDKLLPQAVETFKSRWDGVDWNAVVDQYGAESALKLRNDFEREKSTVQQLQAAKQQQDNYQFQEFVKAETARLPELAPDLADPKFGPQRRSDLGQFLLKAGVPPEAVTRMSALETSLAYDAFRWRDAQAKAKEAASNPKPQAKPAATQKASVKQTATPTHRNPQSARLDQLNRKRSLTIDEAVELLDLKAL